MTRNSPSASEMPAGFSRRDLFREGTGLIGTAGLASAAIMASPMKAASGGGQNVYEAIGVRPIINCRGTFTIISGSLSLPEVKRAMEDAGKHYVQMDELADGVGKKLAEITGAPWGVVSAGCAAGITNMTAACLVGTDPERMQRLPNLTGLKSEVIIPKYSRNVYDHAIRMLGVKIVEVETPEALESAFNERTAMVYILAGPGDEGPLGTKVVAAMAKKNNVPLMVDAAAENLTIPNIHLQRGATVVAYSGGKCLRGPQCAGLLLGDKNLLQAAWANSAPHHAFGRSLKVGKEEIIGMLTAVQMWTVRDHKAEWAQWEGWLQTISTRVTKVPGVTTRIELPDSLSNNAPVMVIEWDGEKVGITGHELSNHLMNSEPRLTVADGQGTRPHKMKSSVSVMPYMMMPGDDKIAAERLFAALSSPPKFDFPPEPSGTPVAVGGRWDAVVEFKRGTAHQTFEFVQDGGMLKGTHSGETLSGDLHGMIFANLIRFSASHRIQGTSLSYSFDGEVNGTSMAGKVNLGEYGDATFTAHRQA